MRDMKGLGVTVMALAMTALAACGGSADPAEGAEVNVQPSSQAPAAQVRHLDGRAVLLTTDLLAALDETSTDCAKLWRSKGVRIGDQVRVLAADGSLAGVGEVGELSDTLATVLDMPGYMCALSAELPEIEPGGRFYEAVAGEWSSEALPEEEIGVRRFVIQVDIAGT